MATTATPDTQQQRFWLEMLIGSSAASTKSILVEPTTQQRGDGSASRWLVATLLLLLGGQAAMGSWHALLTQLEWLVVPLYTLLVVLYLAILVAARPLESMGRWLSASSSSQRKVETNKQQQQQSSSALSPDSVQVDKAVLEADQPFDLSGAYKLVRNDNFEGFLAVQGVPWALRRAANQARPVHRITHRGNQLTIKIEGIIESQTTYIIGGPPVETNVRGRIFQDVVRYLDKENNDDSMGICVSKTALTEDYDVTVQRVLSTDLQEITMTSQATFRDGRKPVQCTQKFQRIE